MLLRRAGAVPRPREAKVWVAFRVVLRPTGLLQLLRANWQVGVLHEGPLHDAAAEVRLDVAVRVVAVAPTEERAQTAGRGSPEQAGERHGAKALHGATTLGRRAVGGEGPAVPGSARGGWSLQPKWLEPK